MSVAWTEPIDWTVCRPDEQASSDRQRPSGRDESRQVLLTRGWKCLALSINPLWNVGLGHPHHHHGSDTGRDCKLDTQIQVRSCRRVHLVIQSLT